MVQPIETNATLLEKQPYGDRICAFRVQPDAQWAGLQQGRIPEFQPGQHVVLGLNGEPGQVLRRPYTITTPPDQKQWLEFFIRYDDRPELTEADSMTHRLWRLEPGGRLHLGPRITGRFTLEATIGPQDPRRCLLVAGGTGITPFASMLRTRTHRAMGPGRFALMHGVSYPDELGFREEFEALFTPEPERYMPTISRPAETRDWTGHTGRVETFFDGDQLPRLAQRLGLAMGQLDPEHLVVFICGRFGTLRHVMMQLMPLGFVPSDRATRKALGLTDEPASMFVEQFDHRPILDADNEDDMRWVRRHTSFGGAASD